MRKEPLVNGQIYHIFSRSIANFKIFNSEKDYLRMLNLIQYYEVDNKTKYSDFITQRIVQIYGIEKAIEIKINSKDVDHLVEIIAYCLMPNHLHLILLQITNRGISTYLNNILNSYTRFFNTMHNRKGPLWETRFKNVLVKSEEQLLHLTRYIHLNPTTAKLVTKPEKWEYSSYREYVNSEEMICKYKDLLDIKPVSYKRFVNARIKQQQELAFLKKLMID